MSRCRTCANFVWQAQVSKHLSDGIIFKDTPLEQPINKNSFSSPQAGCIYSGWKWRARGQLRKPSNMPCDYKKNEELLPCLCKAGTSALYINFVPSYNSHRIMCKNCGKAGIFMFTPEEAKKEWNKMRTEEDKNK